MVYHAFKTYRLNHSLLRCLSRSTRFIFQTYFFLQPVHRDVLQHEPGVKHALKKARDLLSDEEPSEQRDAFEKTVDDVERRWTDVYDAAEKRQDQIQRIIPDAAESNKELVDVIPWLNEAEKKLASLPVLSASPEELSQRKRELKVNDLFISVSQTKPKKEQLVLFITLYYIVIS